LYFLVLAFLASSDSNRALGPAKRTHSTLMVKSIVILQ
jgi:hypothetical protein